MAPRLAVPTFDDLRTGNADPENDAPTAGERVDRHGMHRERRRRTRRELRDPGAELDPIRERGQVRER